MVGLRNDEKDEDEDVDVEDIPKDVLPKATPVGILVMVVVMDTLEKPFAEATIIAERVTDDLFIDFIFVVVSLFVLLVENFVNLCVIFLIL